MKKSLTILTLVILLLLTSKSNASAQAASGSSAALVSPIIVNPMDNRAQILKDYLTLQGSPLADSAQTFIDSADKYNIDWKLVVSISGLESGYGKHQPANSYNGWGWGYSNGSVKHFTSWDEAIEEISKGLRENYLKEDMKSDPYLIGPKYAASPTWAVRVTGFMNQLEAYKMRNAKSTLALAL